MMACMGRLHPKGVPFSLPPPHSLLGVEPLHPVFHLFWLFLDQAGDNITFLPLRCSSIQLRHYFCTFFTQNFFPRGQVYL